jgi:hypothetical protein
VLTSVGAGVIVEGSELWEAPADGSEVKKGDKWLKVTVNGFTGWIAYIHKGIAYCKDFKEITAPPPPVDPPVVTLFPKSFILTDPETGSKAEYEFVKLITP